MLLIILLWILILFVFFVFGFSVVKVIFRISGSQGKIGEIKPDEFFFTGFLTLSSLSGFLSIFIPVGNLVLYCVSFLTLVLFLINFKEIKNTIIKLNKGIGSLNKAELLLLVFLIFFIITTVSQKITLGDTESYHVQSIQWIRQYAVVPGLGNIHGRLAFNSMFFVISGIFTFQIRDILIFPLNGICYVILLIKLFFLYNRENNPGNRWKALFYMLTLLISFLILLPDLNSPSPDIICIILVIYSFILIMKLAEKGNQLNFIQTFLLNLVVFSCITYKLSSLFLIVTLLFLYKDEIIDRISVTMAVGILILSSFIIRNYYLSGYLIYPFSGIDIFNVDWKIPHERVLDEKLWIESWAKIPGIQYSEVVKMKLSEWILPWYKLLSLNNKLLVLINFFSIITFITMLFRRDFFLAKIQLIILINLIFWFIMAPDPRFAHGFIFLGSSLTLAYIVKLFEYSSYSYLLKYLKLSLLCILIIIISVRIKFPLATLRNTSIWTIPSPFGTVETKDYYSDFHYRVPVPGGGCFNAEIPCVPNPLIDIVLRGTDLQDGFKVEKVNN